MACGILGFPGSSVVKNLPANAGDARDTDSIPELGRSLEEEMATYSSILAWKTLWTEEPGGYSPWGHKQLDTTEQATEPTHIISAASTVSF